MIWYDRLYMGGKAKRLRYSIIRDIRNNKFRPGLYVITPPSNGNNILDIYPSSVFCRNEMGEQQRMILGIALGYGEAVRLAARIVDEMYRATGNFDLAAFLGTDRVG